MAYVNHIRYGKNLLDMDNPQPSFKMYILKKVQRLNRNGHNLVRV